eukprot:CAMPEP_0170541818 /NCGR_PEP_ID=MMETSP0211-20121228/1444_1 /TAXON_ID=311385 /ORGANISM="Pseudokeronopsis sp., Strain OXSARD2" /LENGTH=164 /DNA_ID=CAMNT_0010844683 /DNA_START=399 /DNA_END=893 /DNA_ORIENTATION=+
MELGDFILLNDQYQKGHLQTNFCQKQATLANPFSDPKDFSLSLKDCDLVSSDLLRPVWDKYFLRLAEVVQTRSNCMKRAVGAVIVQDLRIVSTGYNGTPMYTQNCNEGGCPRCNAGISSGKGLDECLCIHAEENAVIEGGRAKTKGGTLYVTCFPCLICAKTMV